MDILTLKTETFDSILLKSKEIHKELFQKSLEKRDNEIYTLIDHKRFIFIRIDERTILSSLGILSLKDVIITILL